MEWVFYVAVLNYILRHFLQVFYYIVSLFPFSFPIFIAVFIPYSKWDLSFVMKENKIK